MITYAQRLVAKIGAAIQHALRPGLTHRTVLLAPRRVEQGDREHAEEIVKRVRLTEIETSRENLKTKIEVAKRHKKAWKPMWVQLRDLTNEEDRLRAQ